MRRLGVLFLAFLLGGAWRLKEYDAWMSLSGYCVDAQGPALEQRLWDVFPSRCLGFWPWLLRDADGLREFLERAIPASVDTRMEGLGRFVTTIRWLTPWLKVKWHERLWCISKEGRMWDLSETEAPAFSAEAIKGPVWRLPALEGGLRAPPSGVFASPISTDVIADFMDEYRRCAWFDTAREIVWDRRAGMDLFRLTLLRGGQSFEVLIQREKYAGQDLGVALEEIFARLSKEGGNHLIDATYEGKILLRNLPGGSQEGSMK